MNNKQLAEMIKTLREKKLAEIVGKSPPFNPAHHKATHGEDPVSPNQYVKEGRKPITSGGAQGKATLGRLEDRFAGQKDRGQQNMKGRSLSEVDNIDLGPTETGKKSKEEKEDVTVNPPDTTFSTTDPTNKNVNTREIKEKKNATMG